MQRRCLEFLKQSEAGLALDVEADTIKRSCVEISSKIRKEIKKATCETAVPYNPRPTLDKLDDHKGQIRIAALDLMKKSSQRGVQLRPTEQPIYSLR